MRNLLLLTFAFTLFSGLNAQDLKKDTSAPKGNLVLNSSFEHFDDNKLPLHWLGGGDKMPKYSITVSDEESYSGKHSLKFVSNTPSAPNVYLIITYKIKPQLNRAYHIKFMGKGDKGGVGVIAGRNWFLRFENFASSKEWKEVVNTFVPVAGELQDDGTYEVRLIVQAPSKGYYIDNFTVTPVPEVPDSVIAGHLSNVKKLEKRQKDLETVIRGLKAAKKPMDYINKLYNVFTYQLRVVNAELQMKNIKRNAYLVKANARRISELNTLADTIEQDAKNLASGKKDERYITCQYVSSERKINADGAMEADAVTSFGERIRKPLFFFGYGHFGWVRIDMPYFQTIGMSTAQIEMGPSRVVKGVKKDGSLVYDRQWLDKDIGVQMKKAWDNNIALNLLLSPHYFPNWAYGVYPDLKIKFTFSFLNYDLNHPQAKRILECYYRNVARDLKNHPYAKAIHSLAISNEPMYPGSTLDKYTRETFVKYLKKEYKNISNLNSTIGKKYKSFEDAVPRYKRILKDDDTGLFFDWEAFCQEDFNKWHAWIAGIIKEEWPEIPLHSKMMAGTLLSKGSDQFITAEPEMFASWSDINGNDCGDSYNFKEDAELLRHRWFNSAMTYRLQMAAEKKLVFNSENHTIPDGEPRSVPHEYSYTTFLQQGINGMGATTLWLWERTDGSQGGAAGGIVERPMNIAMTTKAALDLNRLSKEVLAFWNAKSDIAILYSPSAVIRESRKGIYPEAMKRVFAYLSSMGYNVSFVTEKQLISGKDINEKVIICASVSVKKDLYKAIEKYITKGKTFVALGDALKKDEHKHSIKTPSGVTRIASGDLESELKPLLDKKIGKLPIEITVNGKKSLDGMECRIVPFEDGYLLNMVNNTASKVSVRLKSNTPKEYKFFDVLNYDKVLPEFSLEPLKPLIIKVTPQS